MSPTLGQQLLLSHPNRMLERKHLGPHPYAGCRKCREQICINYPGFYPEYLVNPEEVYTTGCPTRPGVDTHQTGS